MTTMESPNSTFSFSGSEKGRNDFTKRGILSFKKSIIAVKVGRSDGFLDQHWKKIKKKFK